MTDKDITIVGHGSGNPSKKNLNAYSSSRYAQKASNGVRKGIVEVRRLKALTDEKRKEFAQTYGSILGRNAYSQSLRDYVYTAYKGKYYSDCSSSIMATFKKIGYAVSLLNTAGIHSSSLFETVPVQLSAGHITNPEILKVGDCILFAGSDPSRPLQIGHVEAVYAVPSTTSTTTKKEVFTMTMSVLCNGCKGTDVGGLQALLKGRGYKDQNGNALVVDNDFGKKTEYAVNRAKKAFGLPQDGVANEALWKKLLGV